MAINLKKIFRYILVGFYLCAGIYHFINPDFYYDLIPDYLPYPKLINYSAGIIEIILAIGVTIKQSRSLALKGIILMLIAFIPSHVYFIQIGSCLEGSICVDPWLAWTRLIVIHPLLMFWAWKLQD